MLIVYAKTNPAQNQHGITAFIIEKVTAAIQRLPGNNQSIFSFRLFPALSRVPSWTSWECEAQTLVS